MMRKPFSSLNTTTEKFKRRGVVLSKESRFGITWLVRRQHALKDIRFQARCVTRLVIAATFFTHPLHHQKGLDPQPLFLLSSVLMMRKPFSSLNTTTEKFKRRGVVLSKESRFGLTWLVIRQHALKDIRSRWKCVAKLVTIVLDATKASPHTP